MGRRNRNELADATLERLDRNATIFAQLENIRPGQIIIYLVDVICEEQKRDPIRQAAWDAFMRGKALLVQRSIGYPVDKDRKFEYIAIGRQFPARVPRFKGCYARGRN